jgi:hypothetical protein
VEAISNYHAIVYLKIAIAASSQTPPLRMHSAPDCIQSARREPARASAFFILRQSGERPERQGCLAAIAHSRLWHFGDMRRCRCDVWFLGPKRTCNEGRLRSECDPIRTSAANFAVLHNLPAAVLS